MAFHLFVSGRWLDKATGDTGLVALELRLSQPAAMPDRKTFPIQSEVPGFQFASPNHLEHAPRGSRPAKDEQARTTVARAARLLQFRDITGLVPTTGNVRSLSEPFARHMLPGAHHWRYWHDPRSNRYLMTDEPYVVGPELPQPDRVAWADKAGCMIATSKWAGIHSPEDGTRLEPITPRQTGAPLQRLLHRLAEAPPPVLETTAVWRSSVP